MANRTAVSIVLTRDPDSTEIYVVERSPKLRFFGGFYACPGGTLDKEDTEIEIKNAGSVQKDSLPKCLRKNFFWDLCVHSVVGPRKPPTWDKSSSFKELVGDKCCDIAKHQAE